MSYLGRKCLAGATALLVAIAGFGVANAADRPSALLVSKFPDRSSPTALSGSTISGNVYIFLNKPRSSQVAFHIDDPRRSSAASSIESLAPFDLATTAPDGTARSFDTTTLSDGRHRITAVATRRDGSRRTYAATFRVQNGKGTPGATSTTSSVSTTTTIPSTVPPTPVPVTPKPTTTAAPPTTMRSTTTVATPSSGQKNCLSRPSACGFPDPTNTGWQHTGVTLKPSGSIRVTQDGAVIDGLDVQGAIDVRANNVTIKRSRITSGDYYPIRYFDNNNTGLVVEDVEIIGTGDSPTAGISFVNYTARRVNIHGTADGLKADGNVVIEDSYIHDLRVSADSHNDGIQSMGGDNITVRHNTISLPVPGITSCMLFGTQSNLSIVNNLLDGGGYTIYLGAKGTNRVISGNRFGRHYGYGPTTLEGTFGWSGNVWDDNLQPLGG